MRKSPTIDEPAVTESLPSMTLTSAHRLIEAIQVYFGPDSDDSPITDSTVRFATLEAEEQEARLVPQYLRLENDLVAAGRVERSALRIWVARNAQELVARERFGLVFSPVRQQERKLAMRLLTRVVKKALSIASYDERKDLEAALAWLSRSKIAPAEPLPLGLEHPLPKNETEWLVLLRVLATQLERFLSSHLGAGPCSRIFSDELEAEAEEFGGLDSFSALLSHLPTDLVSPARLKIFTRDQLERVVLSKTNTIQRLSECLAEAHAENEKVRGELNRSRGVIANSVREFKTVLDAVGEAIVTTDPTGTIVLANREAERMWQVEGDALFGMNIRDLLADGGRGLDPEAVRISWQGLGEVVGPRIESEAVRIDGTRFPITLQLSQTSSGDLLLFTLSARDLTEQRRAETALRHSHERYALAVAGANHGLWDWNLETNDIYYSEQWRSMLGMRQQEINNAPETWFKRIHPDEIDRFHSTLRAHLEGRRPHFEIEHRVRHSDGTYRWMLIRGQAVFKDGKAVRIAGSQVDLTERKVTDALTGLPNRVLFLDRLARLIERRRRDKDYLFAVLFIDLDGFKVVNDSLGHMVGDQLLLAIAQRLEACVRGEDMVARMGGDEFTVLLDGIDDVGDAKRVADRFHNELKAPFFLKRQEVFTSASIGIAMGLADYDQPDDLLRDADTAMYRAKAMGKARYEVFDLAMRDRAVALMQLHTDLRRAVLRSEFELYYQPIVSIKSGETTSFEALVRWQHPDRGLVLPGDFISVAEETGLIVPIGRWVLREACRQLKQWGELGDDFGDVSVAVNLSRKQFARRDLVEQIASILEETQVDPRHLKLELTESMIMQDESYAVELLGELRALDIAICIDDFGTGYSSLSALQSFPIDMLKIDRSFVGRVGAGGENAEIVETIIGLAHNLGMEVTAEGVETIEQLEVLKSLGCDYWQGYYYTKPVSSKTALEFLGPAPQSLFRSPRGNSKPASAPRLATPSGRDASGPRLVRSERDPTGAPKLVAGGVE